MSKQSLGFQGGAGGSGGGGGTGTVTSSGMTAGRVPYATSAQNIENTPLIYNSPGNFFKFGGALSLGHDASPIDPPPSILLMLNSEQKGFLCCPMTQVQRDTIVAPHTGILIYNQDTNQYNWFNGAIWVAISPGGGNVTTTALTAGKIPKATTATNIENSIMEEIGALISVNGGVTVGSTTTTNKLSGTIGGTAPTITAIAGMVTAASIVAGSCDMVGKFQVTYDLVVTANTIFAKITFDSAYASAPRFILIRPVDALTTANGGNVVFVLPTDISAVDFGIRTGSTVTGLSTQTFNYEYLVIQ